MMHHSGPVAEAVKAKSDYTSLRPGPSLKSFEFSVQSAASLTRAHTHRRSAAACDPASAPISALRLHSYSLRHDNAG